MSNSKRLAFLTTLMIQEAFSKAELARRLGVTWQNIGTYFEKDDMKLSKAIEMCRLIGYDMTVALEDPNAKTASAIIDITERTKTNKRLDPIFKYLALNNISLAEVSRRTGISNTSVQAWFRTDDMKLSRIYELAEALGVKVYFRMTPIDE